MMVVSLGVYEFGRRLLESKDLDPVYVVIYHANLGLPLLKRWLLAYWCYYHAGTACWITDQQDYWQAMRTAAASKDWPRSSERRHYRGPAALKSVDWLSFRGLDNLFAPLVAPSATLSEIMCYVKTWYLFGDWIAFKVADMLERLAVCRVGFTAEDVFKMFESPRQGAIDMARLHGPAAGQVYGWALGSLLEKLGDMPAPPRMERPVNVQEMETVLCKWHSHLGGKYNVGKDTLEVRHGLLRFSHCRLAQRLLKAGKAGGLWR